MIVQHIKENRWDYLQDGFLAFVFGLVFGIGALFGFTLDIFSFTVGVFVPAVTQLLRYIFNNYIRDRYEGAKSN